MGEFYSVKMEPKFLFFILRLILSFVNHFLTELVVNMIIRLCIPLLLSFSHYLHLYRAFPASCLIKIDKMNKSELSQIQFSID